MSWLVARSGCSGTWLEGLTVERVQSKSVETEHDLSIQYIAYATYVSYSLRGP